MPRGALVDLNETILIRRPVAAVFDAWARIDVAARHDPLMVERTRLTRGPVGRGTRYRAVDRWPGRLVEYTVEITAFERPDRIAATWSNPVSGGWDVIFEPRSEGTEMHLHATLDPGGLRGLHLRLVGPWYRRRVRAFLEAFRDDLQRGASRP